MKRFLLTIALLFSFCQTTQGIEIDKPALVIEGDFKGKIGVVEKIRLTKLRYFVTLSIPLEGIYYSIEFPGPIVYDIAKEF